MEIGLIYSKDDPRQTETRDFVHSYLRDRGILAQIVEDHQPVASPTVVINGEAVRDRRAKPRDGHGRMFPALADIARAIEQHAWSL
ncbi:MAG TPA: hypothetical protein PK186_12330 [candidate division Zixibacteria bacterium]|nr:hypothetical protein [candidate division Zixibacteria bacterium]MDD4918331.1 hypothetical protein [candidate division Zixibacteria bacterium]MDM7974037.1 hypothetical protein [candidate division Zixibacteria bacterium]HOD67449.1 hypothetical protein [candidate division Zixibacteria bacterium]HPM38334.1 hypothetical protein [candidate division Zixibacteria bacterium]